MIELKSTKIGPAPSAVMAERQLVRLTTRYDQAGVSAGSGPSEVPDGWEADVGSRDGRSQDMDSAMAGLKSTEVAAALSAAMDERRLVRLTTRYDDCVVRGYVLGISPGFVMVAVVSDRVWLDGFECFRRPDIVSVEDDLHTAFIEAALVRRGEAVPDTPAVSLMSIEELLATAGRAFPLVTVHNEEVDPEVCYIGNVRSVVDGRLVLREVTPGAKWETDVSSHLLADITRVSFGADYEEALTLVAEDPHS